MLAKRTWLYAALAGIAIFAGGSAAYFWQSTPSLPPSEAACQGTPHKYKVKIQPDFYLNRNFLPAGPLPTEKDLAEYADRHLRFAFTTVQNADQTKTPRFATIPYQNHKIKITSIDVEQYPFALKIWNGAFLGVFRDKMAKLDDIDSRYMAAAFAKGSTKTSDAAIHVSYEAEFDLYTCEDKKQKFADRISLPFDPFLGTWFVPEEKAQVRFHDILQRDLKLNPCATSEYFNDYDPFYYWYYWSLNEKNCSSSLIPGTIKEFSVTQKESLSLTPQEPMNLSYLNEVRSRTLKVSANFTLIDDDSIVVPDVFAQGLKETIPRLLSIDDFNQVRDSLREVERFDISLRTGLIFAWSLRKNSEDFNFESIKNAEHLLQWRLTGKLRSSHQPYEVLVTVGSANVAVPSYPEFYQALVSGLHSADIVYYGGHSGVGKNLSLSRLQAAKADPTAFLEKGKPGRQLLILASCYALHYFTSENFPKPADSTFVRDILFTASLPSGYDGRFLTGLLEQADRYLDTGSHVPYEEWPHQFHSDLFLVHKKQ